MNKYTFLILTIVSGILHSCYDDKGNYTYDSKYEVKVSGVEKHYSVRSVTGTLSIDPKIFPEGEDYEYTWSCFSKESGTVRIDTLGKERKLSYVVGLKPGAYTFVLNAKHVATGVFVNHTIDVDVTTALSAGWWLLKDGPEGVDMDFFSSDGDVGRNVLKTANEGRQFKGTANILSYSAKTLLPVWNPDILGYEKEEVIVLTTSEDVLMISPADGKIVRESNDLFYFQPERKSFYFFGNGTNNYLMNGGELYSWVTDYFAPLDMKIGLPISGGTLSVAGDYKLSPRILKRIALTPMLFDELSSSFCLPSRTAFVLFKQAEGKISTTKMKADLLFIEKRYDHSDDVAYALMKRHGQPEKPFLLASFNLKQNPPITSIDTLDGNSSLTKSSIWALNGTSPRIYYEKEGRVFSYNIENKLERDEQLDFGGEKVTYMRHYLYKPTGGESQNWFMIVTSSGGHYKVWLCSVGAEGRLSKKDRPDMEGEGRIVDALFRTPQGYTFNS